MPWVQRGLDIDGEAESNYSGWSVSTSSDGNIIAIGATYNINNTYTSGHVRVYIWNQTLRDGAGDWVQRGLDIDGEAAADYSGWSVSISSDGNIVAIGAINNSNNGVDSGHVRVYIWNQTLRDGAGDWVQRGLDIDGEAAGDSSGFVLSLSSNGNIVAIGAPWNDGNGIDSGHVRVYEWNQTLRDGAGDWVQRGADIDGEAAYDQSGLSASLSADGSVVAIGAHYNDGNGVSAGHVRVYSFTEPTPTPAPVCFLADSPVLTPSGYRPIHMLQVGDMVRTAAGHDVVVKRVFAKEYSPSTSANPFVIPKGTFGALRALPISPNHEVMTAKGMVKAKDLGLPRMKMTGTFTYYNLELEDWVRDNLVVAGVECESLAPAKRIVMTKPEFVQFVKARYGPSAAARLRSVCFEESDGRISMPAFQ